FCSKVAPNAAARLVKLPVVRSACATLSVLYRDAKSSNPSLRSMCEALESGVTALSAAACTRASPVIVKLEPQISIANNFACKGLDWLEMSFPVLLSPPDQCTDKGPTLSLTIFLKLQMHTLLQMIKCKLNT
uniref:Perilipin 1 n=1 Tax=Xiphophorus maculatus TaxID=8083 RepID=M3ZUF9_XIPMA